MIRAFNFTPRASESLAHALRCKLGQDAKLIADQIGHSDPAFTTRLYTHLFEDDRQAAGVNLAEAFRKGPAN